MSADLPLPDKVVVDSLRDGIVIPAHPLALTAEHKLDERRQRALTRYYLDAGAGGLAVGVHTTQFAIREPQHDLLRPVLELAAETIREHEEKTGRRIVRVAGVCGQTEEALRDAELASELGYDLGLLNLSAFPNAEDDTLLAHARRIAEVIPLFGFYLQPDIGGRLLSREFFREFAAIPNLIAVKMAAFDRELTQEAIEGIEDSGRGEEVILYTGNDNFIIEDLTAGYLISTAKRHKTSTYGGRFARALVGLDKGRRRDLGNDQSHSPTRELRSRCLRRTSLPSHRDEPLPLRFRQCVPWLHSRRPRNSSTSTFARRNLVSESGRSPLSPTGRSPNESFRGIPAPYRRRLRGRESRPMDG